MQVYAVKQLSLESGERLPIVLDTRTGVPLFDPLVYALHYLRAPGQAANTIEQFCRVMTLLQYWLNARQINLRNRLQMGLLLEPAEINELERLYRLHAEDFRRRCDAFLQSGGTAKAVVALEKVRKLRPQTPMTDEVASQTIAIRLLYTREYLVARAEQAAARQANPPNIRESLLVAKALLDRQFRALAPVLHEPSDEPPPEGLADEQIRLLYSIVDPASPTNPWKNEFVRKRNYLIVCMMHALGVRGGELLKLKTTNVIPAKAMVRVTRSADDPKDPRLNPPQAKTRARDLGVGKDLLKALVEFITTERKSIPAARRRHPFIFTAIDGKPLSLNSLYKIFETLRAAHPGLGQRLTAHMLRYTATDEFFEQLEKSGIEPDQQQNELRYLMGWAEKSTKPFKYGKRHIRKRANQALLERQRLLFRGKKHEKV